MRIRRFVRKRYVIPAAVVVTVLMASVGAYAYWSTAGAGSGSAGVQNGNATPLVIHSGPVTGLYPGGSQAVSFTVDNPNPSSAYVATIHLSNVAVDSDHSSCVTSDFTMADVNENTRVLANASGAAMPTSGTLAFADTTANQDGCKGATLTLSFTSS